MRIPFHKILSILVAGFFLAPCHFAVAHTEPAKYSVGDSEVFWAWDLSVMPPGFQRVRAKVVAVGPRSYIFVDESLPASSMRRAQASQLHAMLETRGLPGSIHPELGIIPLEEKIFAPLPRVVQSDSRVSILITDLKNYNGHRFDGFFNAFDQLPEAEAWSRYEQHSNERNIIYIDANAKIDLQQTASLISHELQHLLAHHARGAGVEDQESWLTEVQGEAAMLFAGFYTDQTAVANYVRRTSEVPLVTNSYVNYGVSILYAAFLIDRAGGYGGFDRIVRMPETGRAAVEKIFELVAGVPASFDGIFGEFISYVFHASNTQELLPSSWSHGGGGLQVPELQRAGTIASLPFQAEGQLLPYSFAIYELPEALPPNASVKLEIIPSTVMHAAIPTCNDSLELLWKPLPGAIAIYGVGCRYGDKRDLMHYRLTIETIAGANPDSNVPKRKESL